MLHGSNQLFILHLPASGVSAAPASGVSAVPAFVATLQLQLGLQSAPQKLCSMCLNKALWQENRQELGSQPSHSYSKDYFLLDRTASSHQTHGKGPKQLPTCESDAETTDGFKCSNGAGVNHTPLSTAREPHHLAICIFQSQGKKPRPG